MYYETDDSSSGDDGMFIHCLLFLPRESSRKNADMRWLASDQKEVKGFVLLPSFIGDSDPEVVQLFKRNSVEILSNHNYSSLQTAIASKSVDCLEFVVRRNPTKTVFSSPTTPFYQVPVSDWCHVRIQQLFVKDVAVYSQDWIVSDIFCTPVDKENSSIVEKLLSVSTDIGYRDPDGETLLHLAVKRRDLILLRLLLKHGIPVDVRRRDGATPLFIAVRSRNQSLAKLLLRNGASVNATTKDGWNCLLHACKYGKVEMAKLLVHNGADVNCSTPSGFTPLHFAVYSLRDQITDDFISNAKASREQWYEIITEMLDKGASINATGTECQVEAVTPLCIAVEIKKFKIVQCLLERGADVNIPCYGDQTVLKLAVDFECPDIVEEILKYNPDVDNTANRKALYKAISKGGKTFDKISELLLKHGFTVDKENDNSTELLHIAISKNYYSVIERLLKCGVNVNKVYHSPIRESEFQKVTPLIAAINHGRNEIVKLLIDSGADVNTRLVLDLIDETPLSATCFEENAGAAEMLLKSNIDLGRVSRDDVFYSLMMTGNSELIEELIPEWIKKNGRGFPSDYVILAASHGSLEMLSVLMKFVRSIHLRDEEGFTALHRVSDENCRETVKFLVKYNADLEARCFIGKTPLMVAAEEGRLPVVKELLKYGARIDSVDESGLSPLHHALAEGYIEIFKVLLGHAFTDFGAILRTNLLQSLQSIHQHNLADEWNFEHPFFHKRYKQHQKHFQQYTATLLHFLTKMNVAFPNEKKLNSFVDQNVKPAFGSDPDQSQFDVGDSLKGLSWDHHLSGCIQEVNQMKVNTVGTSNVLLYDILSANVQQLTHFARNSLVVESSTSESNKNFTMVDDTTENFGYMRVISCQIEKGIFRQELLCKSCKLCHWLVDQFDVLPLDLKEKILDYLNNQELEMLVHACKRISRT